MRQKYTMSPPICHQRREFHQNEYDWRNQNISNNGLLWHHTHYKILKGQWPIQKMWYCSGLLITVFTYCEFFHFTIRQQVPFMKFIYSCIFEIYTVETSRYTCSFFSSLNISCSHWRKISSVNVKTFNFFKMLQELFLLLQKNTLTANIYVIYNEIVTIMEMMYKTDSFF